MRHLRGGALGRAYHLSHIRRFVDWCYSINLDSEFLLVLDRCTLIVQVKLMCSYCKKHDETEVPDPYYGGQQGFEKVLISYLLNMGRN